MRHNLLISTLSALLFNTAIAGLLTLVSFERFWVNFVYSQCIGLSIYAVNAGVIRRFADRRWRWLILFLTFPGSILFGIQLASWLTGVGDWSDPQAWVAVVIGLFFGGIGGITYFLNWRIEKLDAEVKQRRMNEIENEKRQMEAQLKMLQAQIEPHFLFNTLANVSSLIDSDPALAKTLLERLNDWLRIALVRARSDSATLGDELDMLENYLQILRIRFGERLRWQIAAAQEARQTIFPPMLLQPLVENAVRHGIEPKIGGGEIVIRAHIENAKLHIEVCDSGVGLMGDAGGTGLSNVRARLATLYGAQGRLQLQSNADNGVTAILELPR
ncbi:MAG: histidine kinase [Gallionella sp.]|jgi:signal transduction histidine kinase|nr:histidine kinase [Gallionella sp.]MCK9354159.1 histidine kinase [Gallionella sp.]